MSLVTKEIRASASEIYQGKELCLERSKLLLAEMGLPNGLLPLEDMEECGLVKDTGFVWLKQKQKSEHKFDKIGRIAQYAAEITAYLEPKKLKEVTGIRTKEMFMWITVSEVHVDDQPTGKIIFKTPVGLTKAFPVGAFKIRDEEPEEAN